MANVVLGIDPGLSGAIAALHMDSGKLISVFDMPTFERRGSKKAVREINDQELTNLIVAMAPSFGVIEAVSAMPGQGVTSMFRMGAAFGTAKGVMAGLGIPFVAVHPATWKKGMKLSGDKALSRQMATRQWPDMSKSFARVKDDGRAEAALLALWFQRGGHR